MGDYTPNIKEAKKARKTEKKLSTILKIAVLVVIGFVVVYYLAERNGETIPEITMDEKISQMEGYQSKLNQCDETAEGNRNCGGLKEKVDDYLDSYKGFNHLDEAIIRRSIPEARAIIKEIKASNCPCIN